MDQTKSDVVFKNNWFTIGCLGAILLAVFLVVFAGMSSIQAFVQYGIAYDLVNYRAAILDMDIPVESKRSLVQDLETLRYSISHHSRISFFQWMTINASFESILSDGNISDDEYAILQVEIQELKRLQGIEK
ncbi:MAG: hypothetical protein DDG60_14920 [Anaerolineae bacterium]|nr:MAG: hypothetical protein DDG60_14920 [Anaerolineae bacterium]